MRERSFFRALVYYDYHNSKATIFSEQAIFLQAHPGDSFFTLYTYTTGVVKINIQALDSPEASEILGGPGWMDIVSCAERSGGRMSFDVVAYSGLNRVRFHVIPLRRNNSTVHDALRAVADELPAVGPELLSDRLKPLLNSNGEDPDLFEVH
jgi:hypothetical protein